MDYLRITLYVLGLIIIIFTLIPFIRSDHWAFRVFEYPRAQKFVLCLLITILFIWYTSLQEMPDKIFAAALVLNLGYLAYQIFPFTPIAPKQMLGITRQIGDQSLSIMVANVYQFNRRADKCLYVIKKEEPDVVLLVETDQWWTEAVCQLEKKYEYKVLYPQDNTYGMLLFSRLPLEDAAVEFLIEDHIPSIHTKVVLRSGERIQLYCIHPEPPAPQESEDTTERNAEILMAGKMAKSCGLPSIVCGDLNDVAWSFTTELFLKTSGMLDPRRGRGFYNSFHAKYPFLRWPLDHFFCSREFRLFQLKRLDPINSDHFPMLLKVSLETNAKDGQEAMLLDQEEREEVEEKIEKAE
jgi:endonuclease/exonuclease/phosphatase (EEP) superfamily protein YafD